jgi:hypothetical protein
MLSYRDLIESRKRVKCGRIQEKKMSLEGYDAVNLSNHRGLLGVCWIVYGILRVIAGIWLILFSGTSTVMFGALLTRVPNPFALMGDFHAVYAGLVVLSFACGLFGILAGLALLSNQRAARKLVVLAAFLSVSEIPFGTTLGIYTLVVLLSSSRAISPIRS